MLFGCCILPGEYREAAEAGFDFVELSGAALAALTDAEFEEARAAVRSGNAPCLAINSYCGESLPIVGAEVEQEAVRRYAERVCGRAERLGAKMIGIGAPSARRLPAGYDPELADAQCLRFLNVTAAVAAAHGIRVNFEQLHPHQCQYGNRTEEAARLVRRAGPEPVGLVVDFYHRAAAGEREDDFTGFADLIRHTHISTCGPRYERGYPGAEDLARCAGILRALRRAGYRGAMSIEVPAKNLAREGPAALEMLREAERLGGGV